MKKMEESYVTYSVDGCRHSESYIAYKLIKNLALHL